MITILRFWCEIGRREAGGCRGRCVWGSKVCENDRKDEGAAR